MALLQNQRFPYLKIVVHEADGHRGSRRFDGGLLTIDASDPTYDQVMEVAAKSPFITIHEDSLRCPVCGEQFPGRKARALLEIHVEDNHPGNTDLLEGIRPDRNQVKKAAPAGLACDVCSPPQTFTSAEELAAHTAAVHAAAPVMRAGGDEAQGGDTGGPTVVQGPMTTVPAATGKQKRG